MEGVNSNIAFKPETLALIDRIINQFPQGRQKSAILRVLHLAEIEFDNWLSTDVMDYVARLLHIQPIEVYEVASFYSMYNLSPVGKVVLEVCQTGPCSIVGADRIISHIEKSLKIKKGETTSDGMFTLKTVECLGACGYGPMLQINEHYYENLTEDSVDELLSEMRKIHSNKNEN
ncbi:MAG: NAD(P)H-dependent oxidoreductase subunit E [Flavobacteriales bacterium]|nr:NAD(P)H-dependent oxidoreductase subunit E [Flavobacteriales bacterium]